jgi:hypothetical protein
MKKIILALLASAGLCALPSVANAQAGSVAGISQGAALVAVGVVVAVSLLGDESTTGGVGSSGACVGWACTNSLPEPEPEPETPTTTTTTTTT